MTDSMIERVARAARQRWLEREGYVPGDLEEWEELGAKQDDWREVARAAIAAMFQATYEMLLAGQAEVNLSQEPNKYENLSRQEVQDIWQAMVKQVLETPQKPADSEMAPETRNRP